jgi:lysozyme
MGWFDWFKRHPAVTEQSSATGKQSLQVQPAPPLFDEPAANHPTKPPGVVDTIRLQATAQGARAEPEPPAEDAVSEPVKPAKAAPKGWAASPKCLALIKEFEGLRLKSYRCPARVWTIGYGETRGIKPGMVWTRAQAEAALIEGVKPYAKAVAEAIGNAKTTQNQFDALTSFCYNAGPGNLRKSSMLRLHRAGKYQQAGDAFMAWTKGGGRTLPGLVRRRKHERVLYLSKL